MKRICVDAKKRGCEDEKMICVGARNRGCEDFKMRCVGVKKIRCEDVKMYNSPLLEEPFAQTLSKKNGSSKYRFFLKYQVKTCPENTITYRTDCRFSDLKN